MGRVTDKGPVPKDDPMFSGGPQMFSVRRYTPPATPNKLPDEPQRHQFKSQDDFEEAMGRWQETVGRIRAMAARANKNE